MQLYMCLATTVWVCLSIAIPSASIWTNTYTAYSRQVCSLHAKNATQLITLQCCFTSRKCIYIPAPPFHTQLRCSDLLYIDNEACTNIHNISIVYVVQSKLLHASLPCTASIFSTQSTVLGCSKYTIYIISYHYYLSAPRAKAH